MDFWLASKLEDPKLIENSFLLFKKKFYSEPIDTFFVQFCLND